MSDPGRLTARAARLVHKAVTARVLYMSSISTWEIALLVRKHRVKLTMTVEDWVAKCEALPDFPHPDPADRIIAATALTLGAVLVTKDRSLLDYSPVKAVW